MSKEKENESKRFKVLVLDNSTHQESLKYVDTLEAAFKKVFRHTTDTTQSYIYDDQRKLQYKIMQVESFEGRPWRK